MALSDYTKAYKLGKKNYQYRMLHGELPTLEVLDDIIPTKGTFSEVPLGLVQIPIDQIVGTKTGGRSNAFAANFMPILRETSEFARKWAQLSTSHEEEGIREPIKAFEYMNRFYVQEGNKRVSVMKYYGVVSVPGEVTRIIPNRTNDKENKIYYEFLDFYELTKINYIWFSEEGNFKKLLEAVGKGPDEVWNDDERLEFSSIYRRFMAEYNAEDKGKLSVTVGDAFLAFIKLYGYKEIDQMTTKELKELVEKSWEEFSLLEEDEDVELKMDPNTEKKPLINMLLPFGISSLKVAFIYEKTPGSSAWTYAHELGRLHLDQTFPEEVSTVFYDNVTLDTIDERIEEAITDGCDIIFTTTPSFVQASVKAAIANPNVRILNCSVNTSHRYIRTYYARMHEAKFLMGAIAGAMSEHNRLAYIADYPIYGSIANINAFALGAKMINPRAEVYLEWTAKKDIDVMESVLEKQVDCISGKDMVIPEEASRFFGIYHLEGDTARNLAMPLWHWGKFYEQMIRTIMDGTWKYDDDPTSKKAINYWWGMSAGVVDVVCSKNNLPIGTKRLVDLLKETISTGKFNPFSGILYSQGGIVQDDPAKSLTPEEIVTMDWLAENVIGSIPKEEELKEQSKPVVSQQGIENKKG
ncbi:MAG: BMP family ABC transporter substrate-binding protein [Dorea sp.]|uniref:BMP family ABC transporter substrate-binding protein n=1 Tax=Sporofaciens sp. JLR.KK001 TaxID=3112621 RepID=UPI00216BB3E5|nr:BMP family ABC transporter substrate-binding protein [Dorea sp.]